MPAWVLIERQYGDPLLVGPYPDEEVAAYAMDHALLIDAFCEEDCVDCYTVTSPPDFPHEPVLIDLSDPDHTGVGSDDHDGMGLRLLTWTEPNG